MRLIDVGLNALVQGHTSYSSGAAVGAGALALLGLAMATSWQNKLIHKLEGLPSFSPYPVGVLYREFLDESGLGTIDDDLLTEEFLSWERGRRRGSSLSNDFLEWTQQHYDSAAVNTIVHGDPYICRMKAPGPGLCGGQSQPGHHFQILRVDMKGDKLGSDVGPLVRSLLTKHGLQDVAKELPDHITLRKKETLALDPTGKPTSKGAPCYTASLPGRLHFDIHPTWAVNRGFLPSAELIIWE